MYSNFFTSLTTIFLFILILIGLYTISNFFINFIEKYWHGIYRIICYLFKRLIGKNKSDAIDYAIHH